MNYMLAIATVHTTGVNLDSIGVIATLIVVLLTSGLGILRISIGNLFGAKLNDLLKPITDELKDHDTRISRLEGIEEGKRFIVAQQTHSDNDNARGTTAS